MTITKLQANVPQQKSLQLAGLHCETPSQTDDAIGIVEDMSGLKDLDSVLAALDATPQGVYVFASVHSIPEGLQPFATIQEDEGITVVVAEDDAREAGLPTDERYALITLGVHSALDSVGMTATITQTLASRSISCNVIAGYYHDHLFVHVDRATEAASILDNLARQARGWLPPAQA